MDNLHTFYYNPKTGVQYDSVVQPVNAKGSSGPAALYMVTPKTRALARAHFGCPSLPGAPVDVPSGGSHWLQQAINVSKETGLVDCGMQPVLCLLGFV
jgi:hypothetical protein